MHDQRHVHALDGEWQFRPDPDDVGTVEQWFQRDALCYENSVTVPVGRRSAPEAHCSICWYFREFSLDESSCSRPARLCFEAVDHSASVWLNGKPLGAHDGGFDPFSFDASGSSRPSTNLVAVRVVGRGIWGSVTFNVYPSNHLLDVYIQPDIRRSRITATSTATGPGQVRYRILDTSFSAKGHTGPTHIDMPEFEPWNPDDPRIYTLVCELHDGDTVLDAIETRFGMREFTIREGQFHFNGRSLFLKGILHDLHYPTLCTRSDYRDMVRSELVATQEAGFNLVSFALVPSDDALHILDELGLMAAIDLPSDFEEIVRAHRNHPSVVIWNVAPEGAPDLHALDPSRVVVFATLPDMADSRAIECIAPYRDSVLTMDWICAPMRAPVALSTERYLRHAGSSDRLSVVSQFGGRRSKTIPDAASDFSPIPGIHPDVESLIRAADCSQQASVVQQLDSWRANPSAAGYFFPALCTTEIEMVPGILDHTRARRDLFDTVRELQQPIRLLIDILETNLVLRQEVPVTVSIANDARLEAKADISLQVVGPTNQVLWKKKRGIRIPKTGRELWEGTIAASGSSGTHKFIVRLMQGTKCLAEARREFFVFHAVQPFEGRVDVFDPHRMWTERCLAFCGGAAIQASVYIIPPFASTIRAYPDNELAQVLGQAYEGAVALFFSPPDDWNDLADVIEPRLRATTWGHTAPAERVIHYAKLHPVFDELPAGSSMAQPYRHVVRQRAFLEESEEDVSTMLCAWGDPKAGEVQVGCTVLVKRYGSGRVVFCHLNVLDALEIDPVSQRMFVNMLQHFSRRSVTTPALMPVHQKAVEWIRAEKQRKLRHWRVLGPFPNWNLEGHDTAYPPENGVDLNATYPGWNEVVSWRHTYSNLEEHHTVRLDQSAGNTGILRPNCATGYAYAELTSDTRHEVELGLRADAALKLWVNDRLVFETSDPDPAGQRIEVLFKEGRNSLLVKTSKTFGPHEFSIDLPTKSSPLKWWK